MDFDSFLGQLDGAPKPKPAPVTTREEKRTPAPAPTPEPIREEKKVSTLNEDVEKIYEVTSIIMKTVRKAFPEAGSRKMAYESIQNAINMTLGESVQMPPQQYRQPAPPTYAQPTPPYMGTGGTSAMLSGGEYMSEKEWLNSPAVMEGDPTFQTTPGIPTPPQQANPYQQETPYQQAPAYESIDLDDGVYSRNIDIKQGQGLTECSEQDIRDLQILAGIKEVPGVSK